MTQNITTIVLINTTTNGKLFMIDGNGVIDPPLWIVHLYGESYYDMGVAYGELMREQIENTTNFTLEWIYSNINEYIEFLSPEERDIIDQDSVFAALDYVYDLAIPYISSKYVDMMTGIADGTGIPYVMVARLNMIPELIKAKCSMVGAWGNAIINGNANGSLVQMRALDNGEESPLPDYPTLAVYHTSDIGNGKGKNKGKGKGKGKEKFIKNDKNDKNNKNGQSGNGLNDYTVLAYPGFVGAFTGYSNAQLGICEKYWGDESCQCKSSRRGQPWTFVLQDVLEQATTKDEGMCIVYAFLLSA